jgi:hypothetical protein
VKKPDEDEANLSPWRIAIGDFFGRPDRQRISRSNYRARATMPDISTIEDA